MATNRQVQVGDEENLPPEGAAAQDRSVERGISSLGSFPGVGGQSNGGLGDARMQVSTTSAGKLEGQCRTERFPFNSFLR